MEFCIAKGYVNNRGEGPIPCSILAAKNGERAELCEGTMAELEHGNVRDGVFYQGEKGDWIISSIPDAMQMVRDPREGEARLSLTATLRNAPELYKFRDVLGRLTFTTDGKSVYLNSKYICGISGLK